VITAASGTGALLSASLSEVRYSCGFGRADAIDRPLQSDWAGLVMSGIKLHVLYGLQQCPKPMRRAQAAGEATHRIGCLFHILKLLAGS
jgi:hypothetical protein